jgi:hypothetical protein
MNEGDPARARLHLERAISAAAFERPAVGALPRPRLAPLPGGAAGARLTAEAEATLLHHGVVAPARFAGAFATWPRATGTRASRPRPDQATAAATVPWRVGCTDRPPDR